MKLNRFARLVIIVISWLMISLSCLWAVMIALDSEMLSDPMSIVFYVLFILSFLIPALYMLLYNKRWIVAPAKIILLIVPIAQIFIIAMAELEYLFIAPFLLTILSLIYLYKDTIKDWAQSLKSKPFIHFKKKAEILDKDILIISLAAIAIFISCFYTRGLVFSMSLFTVIAAVLIFTYLLSKKSPLKSILKAVIFFASLFALYKLALSFLGNGYYISSISDGSNDFVNQTLMYIRELILPVFALLILLLPLKNK